MDGGYWISAIYNRIACYPEDFGFVSCISVNPVPGLTALGFLTE
jgi:hypothetical protein